MNHKENIREFEDTMERCQSELDLVLSIAASKNMQKVIRQDDELPKSEKELYDKQAQLLISDKRTVEAAFSYKDKKTAILNFASAVNPGGGVVQGASAQEECICRCTTLYPCLNTKEMCDDFYIPHREEKNPLHNDDIIYTPEVSVIKTDSDVMQLLPYDDRFLVDVITCAAPNLSGNNLSLLTGKAVSNIGYAEILEIHKKRLKRILDVAVSNNVEVIILGAFGCGAFDNDPKAVAEAAGIVIPGYLRYFETIEYAIYCGKEKSRNYRAFDAVIKSINDRRL